MKKLRNPPKDEHAVSQIDQPHDYRTCEAHKDQCCLCFLGSRDEVHAPLCPTRGHGQMKPAEAHTREQQFCGEWWRCERCTNSVLMPSSELLAQLGQKSLDVSNDRGEELAFRNLAE